MNQSCALKILQTGVNVFLTGEPGSGKTYTINRYISYLRSHSIDVAVTASTGIAATHIGGVTIHSWSGIGIKGRLENSEVRTIAGTDRIRKKILKAKVLIIDEISMLPAETLQSVEAICRKVKNNSRPFGGMQVVLVGDFFQLPPVVSKSSHSDFQEDLFSDEASIFAYGAPVWTEADLAVCYLTDQYRQNDESLLTLLSKIRKDSFDANSLELIQSRQVKAQNLPADAPKLYSHNVDVDTMNDRMLARIQSEPKIFEMEAKGNKKILAAMVKGCLSPEYLALKVGAAVMFTKNNLKEGFANGTLGEVVGFGSKSGLPIIQLRNGREIEVGPAEWIVEEDGMIRGWLSQLPLRLAWALTVHKSQGVSLDEAAMDLSRVFEFGQGYVALSRVRTLSGLHILGWNEMAFKVDPNVHNKDQQFRVSSEKQEKAMANLAEDKIKRICEEFIVQCGGSIGAQEEKAKIEEKVNTLDETYKRWIEGNDILSIAEARNLTYETILGHIEKLVLGKQILPKELDRIITADLKEALPQIHKAFKELDTDKLTPLFAHFKGKYSYVVLRIAKLTIG